ncbi:MAG: ATP phosphoribosyltransferase regulatory subunit, partial [Lachnospiraceae bacterium]|nr:ATP phosphoribosyltransferase regulatory subunit [Lachnospiraceae bacterium]
MQKILHTPEGVRDIYNKECEQKLLLQERLHSVIKSFGYRDIETPTFEFFDVFGKEVGTTPSRDLYKFFDREGNTLVLRPDFTPSIARAASKYLLGSGMPVRLTYLGNTFINNSSYQGRLKENTQIGAELIGEDSADADAEVIALVIQALKKAGLQEFQISIGHAGFFRALAEEAGFDDAL